MALPKNLVAEEMASNLTPVTFEIFCQKVLAYYPKLKQQGATVEIAIARKFQASAERPPMCLLP